MGVAGGIGSDKIIGALLIMIMGYMHYLKFQEIDTLAADDDYDPHYQWKYYSWEEFRRLGLDGEVQAPGSVPTSWGKNFPTQEEDPSTAGSAASTTSIQAEDKKSIKQPLLLISIYGYIFNVTSAPHFYKQGEGGYAIFNRREATRAMATASLEEEDLDRDLTGLTQTEIEEAQSAFEETYLAKYPIVGRISKSELPWNRGKKGFKDDLFENMKIDPNSAKATAKEDGNNDSEDISPSSQTTARSSSPSTAGGDGGGSQKGGSLKSGKGSADGDGGQDEMKGLTREEEEKKYRRWRFKPKPFVYDPYMWMKEKKVIKRKREGRCPMRKIGDAAVAVVNAIKSIPLLMR